ncbi:MAG: hypothetical protein JNL70_26820 [Saprospiraceae bacterium]|nr:hypothetical protein [Saprospiraceae bacterium]
MRIFKFVLGGLFGLLLISVVLKALFFLTFAAMLVGGAFMARRAYMMRRNYMGGAHFHPMQHRMAQIQGYQIPIESLDDLVNRQEFTVPFARPKVQYREADFI